MLKGTRGSHGYIAVNVTRADGTRTKMPIHTAVLLAHVGPCPPGQEARHLNDIKDDCRWPENLVYGPRPANMADAVRNGRNRNAAKTMCAKAGHPLSGDNLRVITRPDGSQSRECKECARKTRREWARAHYVPKAAA